jgi:AraC-like DNA-binding protein
MKTVTSVFAPILDKAGKTFFFPIKGELGCLMNLRVSDNFPGSEEVCTAWMDRLKEMLRPVLGQSPVERISISRIAQMERGPRMLYRCAVIVSERRTEATAPIYSEYDLPTTDAAAAQTIPLEFRFWQQIQQHAFFLAATTLEQLSDVANRSQQALEHIIASVFWRMEQVMRSISSEVGTDISRDPEFAPMLPALTQAQTFQELQNRAYDILATLEDRFYTPTNARNSKMPSIERYIQQNYTDPALGASAIAQHFKISTSYLSRIFKADMGIGLVEYIHRIRVDAAKKLLRTGDASLDDIATQVGFSNRWVLIRAFKQQEGITPGAYRQAAEP